MSSRVKVKRQVAMSKLCSLDTGKHVPHFSYCRQLGRDSPSYIKQPRWAGMLPRFHWQLWLLWLQLLRHLVQRLTHMFGYLYLNLNPAFEFQQLTSRLGCFMTGLKQSELLHCRWKEISKPKLWEKKTNNPNILLIYKNKMKNGTDRSPSSPKLCFGNP